MTVISQALDTAARLSSLRRYAVQARHESVFPVWKIFLTDSSLLFRNNRTRQLSQLLAGTFNSGGHNQAAGGPNDLSGNPGRFVRCQEHR